jgi:hypothetical protein
MPRSNAVPADPTPPRRAPDLTVTELATLKQVHPSQILRLVRLGLPCSDLSTPYRPGARRKRLLRFSLPEVDAWLRERSAVGGAR